MTGPAYMPPSMNPIQLLEVLSGIDARKKQLALDAKRMEQQSAQFEKSYQQAAEQLGFQKGEEHRRNLTAAIQNMQGMTPDQRQGALSVYQSNGTFEPAEMDALTAYIKKVPLTPQTAQNQAITAGAPLAGAPAGQLQGADLTNRVAYDRATTGMETGDLAGLPSFLNARVPTGQKDSRGQNVTLDAPGMARMTKEGLVPSSGQAGALGADYARLRLEAMRDQNQFLSTIMRERVTHGSLSAENRVLAFQHMSEIAAKLQQSQSDTESDLLSSTWNGIASELGLPQEIYINNKAEMPKATSFFTKLMQKAGQTAPPGTPGSGVPPAPFGAGVSGPSGATGPGAFPIPPSF